MVKKIDWKSLDPIIVKMHSEGRSAYAISKEVGLERETVAKHLEKDLGLPTTRRGPRPVVRWVSDTEIQCNTCDEVKPCTDFYSKKMPRLKKGIQYSSRCKECIRVERLEKYKDKPMSWSKKLRDIEASALRRGLICDVSEEYLLFVYTTQNKLCVYTDTYLPFTTGNQSKSGPRETSLSIDRFDQEKGYVVGNILVCSSRANSIKLNQSLEEFKTWMPSWYERGVAMLEHLDNVWKTC